MARVAFKKGPLARLPVKIYDGTFYVTTDERALYLDVDDTTRIRIGDLHGAVVAERQHAFNINEDGDLILYYTGPEARDCYRADDGTLRMRIAEEIIYARD